MIKRGGDQALRPRGRSATGPSAKRRSTTTLSSAAGRSEARTRAGRAVADLGCRRQIERTGVLGFWVRARRQGRKHGQDDHLQARHDPFEAFRLACEPCMRSRLKSVPHCIGHRRKRLQQAASQNRLGQLCTPSVNASLVLPWTVRRRQDWQDCRNPPQSPSLPVQVLPDLLSSGRTASPVMRCSGRDLPVALRRCSLRQRPESLQKRPP